MELFSSIITLFGPTLRPKLLSVPMAELGQTPLMLSTRMLLLCVLELPSMVPVVLAIMPGLALENVLEARVIIVPRLVRATSRYSFRLDVLCRKLD